MLRVLDLFSGIGGFSLGLERTGGFKTVAFCEIDPFCQRVLHKHWKGAQIHEDIRGLTRHMLRGVLPIHVICAGFPCQDISLAADAPAGVFGERSGLWQSVIRLLCDFRDAGDPLPLLILENVSALLHRGLDVILAELAAIGYDAEWHCIPASAVGAPHPRDRLWIVAYTPEMFGAEFGRDKSRRLLSPDGLLSFVYDEGRENHFAAWRATESELDRTLHGVSDRVDRLGALSNSVVPQIPELIGNAILQSMCLKSAPAEKLLTGDGK